MAAEYYCRNCKANVQAFRTKEGERAVARCAYCGLPVEEAEIQAIQAAAPAEPKARLLLVEDDQALCRILSAFLGEKGFTVTVAHDGAAGFAAAQKEEPEIILSDVMMPQMDGYQLCQRVRADALLRETPVILFTAIRDPKLSSKAFQAGADLALSKPIDPEQLLSVLQMALGLKKKRAGARAG